MAIKTYEAIQPAENVWVYPGGYTEPYCDVVLRLSYDPAASQHPSIRHTVYTVSVLYLPRRNETRNPELWDTRFLLDARPLPNAPTSVRFPASGSQTLTAGTSVVWYTMPLTLENDGTQHTLSFKGVCKTTAPRFFPNYPLSITFTTPRHEIIPGFPEEAYVTYDAAIPKLTYYWSEATDAVWYTLTRWFYYGETRVRAGDFVSTRTGTTSLTYEEIAAGEVCETDRSLFDGLTEVQYMICAYSRTGNWTGAYQEYTLPSDTPKVFVKVNGIWRKAIPWVKVNGVWKKAKAWVKVNGAWKSTIS